MRNWTLDTCMTIMHDDNDNDNNITNNIWSRYIYYAGLQI